MRLREKGVFYSESRQSFDSYIIDSQSIEDELKRHDHFELVFIERGEGYLQMGTSDVPVRSGLMACMGPGLLHLWESSRSGKESQSLEGFVLHFSRRVIPKALLDLPEANQLKAFISDAENGLHFQARDRDRIRARMRSLAESRGMLRLARLHVFLELLAMQPNRQVFEHKGHKTKRIEVKDARLASVTRFLRLNSHRPINRRDAAKFIGMEENAFSRFFHRACGQSFVDYLANIRIQKAVKLLVDRRGLSIIEVANACGFRNQSAFNRQFLKRLGSTPSSYRKSADLEPLEP